MVYGINDTASVRFYSLEEKVGKIFGEIQGASGFEANIRIRVPFKIRKATDDGAEVFCCYDEGSKTLLLKIPSVTGKRNLVIE